jgi:hypothetical protein
VESQWAAKSSHPSCTRVAAPCRFVRTPLARRMTSLWRPRGRAGVYLRVLVEACDEVSLFGETPSLS